MLQFRTLRPLSALSAPLSTFSIPLVLPIRIRLRCLSTSTTETSEQPISSSPPSSTTPTSTHSFGQPEAEKHVQLPYFVGRNKLNNLGVYGLKKRGGNLKLTLLKNGEGNLQALKQDLANALQLNEGDVSINSVTKHLVIRGHKQREVLNFLHTMGF
ncbi:mitochondrial large subunit ribosomal protein-domain-containing protein [Hypoxylon sp. NC1633]|nr:mitochondrial large subunit ribosomal protein-domain-containing protein [Hypoxylon sp. NC1633]